MEELIPLYDELQRHTFDDCLSHCQQISHCCHPSYCDSAAEYTQVTYGVTLARTGHPYLPFMGPGGCVVPAHQRPRCTAYCCSAHEAAIGGPKKNSPWYATYLGLLTKITHIRLRERKHGKVR